MFKVMKNGTFLCTEDYARYTRLQSSGIYALCSEDEADSIVANDEIHPLSTIQLIEFNGAAELAETKSEFESLLSDARDGLNPIPTQGAAWNAETRYIAGDTVEGGYVALKYSRNKPPEDNLGTYWAYDEAEIIAWDTIEDGTIIYEGGVVSYGGKTWRCTAQHMKSSVYKPKEGSSKWEEVAE